MKDINHERCCVETENYLNSIGQRKNEALKNIGCSVECGYDYLGAFSGKPLSDLCKYLNLWLDEQKRIHVKGNSGIAEEEWNDIENLWKYLLEKDPSSKCRRETNGYNISNKENYMKLLSYCLNRDYIKSLCESTISFSINIPHACSAFYNFVEGNYESFYKENQCIDYSIKDTDYSHNISDECTLYNMAITFPIISVQEKKIL
ncbi:hypothetical protein PVBG_05584 [Plasmodium vivax Brazil I]|uniref:PIR Superfamily Protein n=1 Tax=Plasmodium vivax (strain Brazil I) TaxID=1033975 RepID=A0A0J9SN98_PLAV1|nr:hypothetical protein PVBG_05584 [Plasmodium vivax Brazil I]